MSTVLAYGDVVVTKDDIKLLDDSAWLNDTILEFLERYIETQTIGFLRPAVAHLLRESSALPPGVLPETLYRPLVFVPVNNQRLNLPGGTHWSLLIYVAEQRKVLYFDSVGDANRSDAIATTKALLRYVKPTQQVQFESVACPRQSNGNDCGVFVLLFTNDILAGIMGGQSTLLRSGTTSALTTVDASWTGDPQWAPQASSLDDMAVHKTRQCLLQLIHHLASST